MIINYSISLLIFKFYFEYLIIHEIIFQFYLNIKMEVILIFDIYFSQSSQTNIEHKSCKNCISSNVNIASACTIKLFAGACANLTTWVTVILRCKVSQSEVTVITITSSIINHQLDIQCYI